MRSAPAPDLRDRNHPDSSQSARAFAPVPVVSRSHPVRNIFHPAEKSAANRETLPGLHHAILLHLPKLVDNLLSPVRLQGPSPVRAPVCRSSSPPALTPPLIPALPPLC